MKYDPILTLAQEMETKYPALNDVLKHTKYHYKAISIPKKNGKFRKLYSPSSLLRSYQKWLLREIVEKAPVHSCCTAYQKGVSLQRNVVPHQHHLYFLCIDIEEFFSNTSAKKVHHFFRSHTSYNAALLTKLCTLNGGLPQGAITSPTLSNAVNYRLDCRIAGYANKNRLAYTRYADDITLSGNNLAAIKRAYHAIKYILNSEGYKLNHNKTRILKPGVRRKITGLLINEHQEVRIGREKYRNLRSMIYNYKNSRALTRKDRFNQFLKIKGWLSYLHQVDLKTYHLLVTYSTKLYEKEKKNPFFLK